MSSEPLSISYEAAVREFHVKYGHLISDQPTSNIPDEVKILRRKLILEEVEETLSAMGFTESGDWSGFEDIVEIADGIADTIYVLVGTAISYGIPIDRVFREVHSSNMTKTPVKAEPGKKYGTKTPKGPDYKPPQIDRILYSPDITPREPGA